MLQVAEYLLEQGADVNAQDKGGLIPLHNASSYGHLDIAALLIKYNTIVNATGKQQLRYGACLFCNLGQRAIEYKELVPLPLPDTNHK